MVNLGLGLDLENTEGLSNAVPGVLLGAIAVNSNLIAALSQDIGLGGQITAGGSVAGALAQTHALAGVLSAVAGTGGTLTVTSGGAWAPSDLPALQVWFDASDLTTMWEERTGASATTQSTVNGVVGTWLDKSVNGYYAVAASDAERPILRQAGALYYLDFDGVDDYLRVSDADLSDIVQPSTAGVASRFEAWNTRIYDGIPGGRQLINAPSTNWALWSGSMGTDMASGVALGEDFTSTAEFNGSSSACWISGVEFNAAAVGNIGTQSLTALTIGADSGAEFELDGRVYGLVINGGSLSAGDRASLEQYLADLAGVTL